MLNYIHYFKYIIQKDKCIWKNQRNELDKGMWYISNWITCVEILQIKLIQ